VNHGPDRIAKFENGNNAFRDLDGGQQVILPIQQ